MVYYVSDARPITCSFMFSEDFDSQIRPRDYCLEELSHLPLVASYYVSLWICSWRHFFLLASCIVFPSRIWGAEVVSICCKKKHLNALSLFPGSVFDQKSGNLRFSSGLSLSTVLPLAVSFVSWCLTPLTCTCCSVFGAEKKMHAANSAKSDSCWSVQCTSRQSLVLLASNLSLRLSSPVTWPPTAHTASSRTLQTKAKQANDLFTSTAMAEHFQKNCEEMCDYYGNRGWKVVAF